MSTSSLQERLSKMDTFPLMDLPMDLVHLILDRTVTTLGIKAAVRARLANKLFASEILRAVCKPGIDWTNASLSGFSTDPIPVTLPFVTGTFMSCIQFQYGIHTHFLSAILAAEELLMNEIPGQSEEQRMEYRYTLCALENWRTLLRPEGFLTDIAPVYPEDKPTVKNSEAGVNALCAAAAMGNVGLVLRFLEKGVEMNVVDGYFRTPFEQACKNGHYETAHLLLERGADFNLGLGRRGGPLNVNRGPLFLACLHGHTDIVRLILEPKYNLHPRTSIIRSAILPAIQGGHLDLVQLLMQLPSKGDKSLASIGDMMLTEAVRYSQAHVVRWLLENGVHPNNENEWQRVWNRQPSILQEAALRSRVEIVRLLLQAGANRFVPALTYAARNNHVEVAQALLDTLGEEKDRLAMVHGRQPFESKAANATEQTPLLQAAKNGHVSMVRWLLERGCEVDFMVVERVFDGDYEILRLLLGAEKKYQFEAGSANMLRMAMARRNYRNLDLLREVRGAHDLSLVVC